MKIKNIKPKTVTFGDVTIKPGKTADVDDAGALAFLLNGRCVEVVEAPKPKPTPKPTPMVDKLDDPSVPRRKQGLPEVNP